MWPPARAAGFAAVLELPLGDVFDEDAAVYRATIHGRPVVNGNSAFIPPHYVMLKTALDERDPAALDGLPPGAPVLIVVDRRKDVDRAWEHFVDAMPRVRPVASDERWSFYSAAPPADVPLCAGKPAPIASARDDSGPVDLAALSDRNPSTYWITPHAQREGDALVLDLGVAFKPCALTLSVGGFRNGYPRALAVDTSNTGIDWTTVATAVARCWGCAGRFVRLRLDESHPTVGWAVTDVAVRIASEPE